MTEGLGKAEQILRQMGCRKLEAEDAERLREDLKGALRFLGAVVWQFGGEVEVSELALMEEYEVKRSDVPERHAVCFKARPVRKMARGDSK